jgi:hypothetical protein
MYKPGYGAICGVVGVTLFGAAYDAGLFGSPDGQSHVVLVTVTASTTSNAAGGVIYQYDNVTGQDFAVAKPLHVKVAQS